jgi:hypothetical protein
VQYRGDFDTHGIAISHALRVALPTISSVLMDRQTLAAHRAHWVREPKQTQASLPGLTAVEQELYQDLVANIYGPRVRLEQERIRFGAVKNFLGSPE